MSKVKGPYYVIVNDAVAPGSPYQYKKDAEAALAERVAKDQAVDNPIAYDYLIVAEV